MHSCKQLTIIILHTYIYQSSNFDTQSRDRSNLQKTAGESRTTKIVNSPSVFAIFAITKLKIDSFTMVKYTFWHFPADKISLVASACIKTAFRRAAKLLRIAKLSPKSSPCPDAAIQTSNVTEHSIFARVNCNYGRRAPVFATLCWGVQKCFQGHRKTA